MYPALRALLFTLDPERAHGVTLGALRRLAPLGWGRLLSGPPAHHPVEAMGLRFPNPVGLAAGLDKNGDYIQALASLGFGFIEIGTVTPRPQAGNPKPRLFRLPRSQALINRMGFNNRGVDHLVQRVIAARFDGVLGINIGKNFDTPLERAVEDYIHCLQRVYPHAGYVVVNVSSPNTPGLRSLQHGSEFDTLLRAVTTEQRRLARHHRRHVPLVVKLAPDDLDDERIAVLAERLLAHGVDGVTATNTTLSRHGVEREAHAGEGGGLSGRPLLDRSTTVLQRLAEALGGQLPLIGVGGIHSGADAARKRRAGAALVQLYTGLIYRGPALIGEAVRTLAALEAERSGCGEAG